MVEIIYKDFSYRINGLCFKVHNRLGRFCKEKQYADLLEEFLRSNKINYRREISIPIKVAGQKIKGNILDFIVENKIVLECKATKFIGKEEYNQVQRYLKATNCKLGIIVNFRQLYLKPKRIIFYTQKSDANDANFPCE